MNAPSSINLYQAKTQLSALVDRAAAGEEIIIAKNGKPMAKLVPIPVEQPRRVLEMADWAKKLTQEERDKLADDVMKPLPEDIWDGARWEGWPPTRER